MDKWTSVLESNPTKDGLYYVYVMNCMDNSSDVKKLQFQNGKWEELSDEYDKIIAWKNIYEKNIEDSLEWIKEHSDKIKSAFNYYEIDCNWFCIAETLTECLYEYPYFLWSGYVRFIDNVYVIKVL